MTICDMYSRSRIPRHQLFGLLQSLPILEKLWSSIFMDFIVDLLPSEDFDSIFVDQLTEMALFVPCNKMVTDVKTIQLFVDKIYK